MTMLDEALRYLDRGWSVIPAQRKGKKALVEWEEYSQRKPTPEEIKSWWKKWPNANIAVITGRVSNLVAVDIDPDRGGDPRKVYNRTKTGLISRTGSNGYHLFYSYPTGTDHVYNKVGKDGIDIRGDGGYVIAPPSVHASGKKYEFVSYSEPAVLPSWLTDEVEEEGQENNDRWLSDILSGVGQGGRNDAATRLAGYFASKDMAKEVAAHLLKDWNSKNEPPLHDRELTTVLDSVYKTEFRRNKNRKRNGVPQSLSFMHFGSYMSRFGDMSIRWCIKDWLPDSTIAFVISPPGTYKTWTVFDLAVSVAGGHKFLGQYEVINPGPVLILQQEDFHGQIVERIASVVTDRHGFDFDKDDPSDAEHFECPNAPDLPIVFHPDRALRFDDTGLMHSLEQYVAKVKPRLVIIDPLYSAGNVDDYMAKTAEQMFPLKKMRDTYGCSFLVVHHTKKKAEGTEREGGWGSQFLNAFMETGWQIRRSGDNNSVVVHRHFKVKGEIPDLHLTFDISTERPYKYNIICEDAEEALEEYREKTKSNTAVKKAETDILVVLRKGPAHTAEIARQVGVHKSTISRRMGQLEKAGVVVKNDKDWELAELPDF